MTAVAVVAIEVKLSRGEPALQERSLRWSEANDRYDFGIDPKNPLDVAVYDKLDESMVDVSDLMQRWTKEDPTSWGANDEETDAYEATAIIAMSQGSLMFHSMKDEERRVMIPEYAFGVLSDTNDSREYGLPWIATAAG